MFAIFRKIDSENGKVWWKTKETGPGTVYHQKNLYTGRFLKADFRKANSHAFQNNFNPLRLGSRWKKRSKRSTGFGMEKK